MERSEDSDLTRGRLERLSGLLAELDPGAERTRISAAAIRPLVMRSSPSRRPAAWKVAAAIALLLGLTWAVPPARAWMLERARTAAQALGFVPHAPPPVAAPVPNTATQSGDVRVAFPIAADTFDITVTPAAGQLIVRRNRETLGTAEAASAPGTDLTISRGLRIAGAASASAIYTITLPERVIAVRVRDRVYPLPSGPGELRLDLARP